MEEQAYRKRSFILKKLKFFNFGFQKYNFVQCFPEIKQPDEAKRI